MGLHRPLPARSVCSPGPPPRSVGHPLVRFRRSSVVTPVPFPPYPPLAHALQNGAAMPRSLSRGFTLVEVLVATALLVTIAAGTAQMFAIAIRHGVASRQQLAMSLAASRKIDELAEVI